MLAGVCRLPCPLPRGRPLLIELGVPIDHSLDETRDLLKLQGVRVQEGPVLLVVEKLTRDRLRRQLIAPLHRTLMLIDAIGIIALFALDSGILRKEILVELDFVNEELVAELVDIVDQNGGLVGAAPRTQRFIKSLIVLQVELNAEFRRPVLDAHVHWHDDARVVERLQLLRDVVPLRFQLHVHI